VFTNKPACGAKRGHGTPQPRFGQEIQLDKIAEKLGQDPAELRLRQLVPPSSITANWLSVGSTALEECLRQVVERSGWKDKHRKLPAGHGVGIACGSYLSGAGLPIYWNKLPHSGVQLLLDRSGQVTVYCGAAEVGQGSDDVLARIVAEILGVELFDVRVVTGDTAITPIDLGSYSSRVTLMMGNAAIGAAERVRDLLAGAVAARLGTVPEQIRLAGGRAFTVDDPEVGVTFREAVELAETAHGTLGALGSYTPARPVARFKGGGVGPSPAYSYTACVVQVEVDENTGWVHVPQVWVAHDIGRALNPGQSRGQVVGCVYMGLSEALMEEQSFRRLRPKLSHALVHRGPSLLDYKSLTSRDMPEVDAVLVEEPDPNGPFGAKEVGQGPLLPVMPAVANAIHDAVGVRIDSLPITPDKVLRALELKARGLVPRVGPESFPAVPYPEPVVVAPPGEGGDGREAPGPAVRTESAAGQAMEVARP
jgi:4-hydroxybenzoyl-CoA reductase subunit alpha